MERNKYLRIDLMERNKHAKRKKHKQVILIILMVGFAVVFLCSAYLFISNGLAGKREQAAFDELIVQIDKIPSDEVMPSPLPQEGTPEVKEAAQSRYQGLFDKNADFIGWLSIAGTRVNYPVMLSPNDPEYYLHRGFDGSESFSGVPFLGEGCTEDSNNLLIYGHNMKNGTMFSDLLKYADAGFAATHPTIQFNTLTKEAKYEVAAAFYSQVYSADEPGVFRYYNYGGELDRDTFTQYLDGVRKAALYDTGVALQDGDKLLTLSTCSYHTSGGRFVVVARKVVE